MNKLVGMLGVALVALPSMAGADYLSEAFRGDTCAEHDKQYSGADPVIATVPMALSEIDRVSNNFLVYTGFTVTGTNQYRGHVYGLRLFSEKTEYGNDWEFTATTEADLLTNCGDPNAACMFDAGAMLKEREAPRRILVGKPAASALDIAASASEISVPIGSAEEVPATSAHSVLRGVWEAYRDVPPIKAELPESGWNWKDIFEGWNCKNLPTRLPDSLKCYTAGRAGANNLGSPSDGQLDRLGLMLHGASREWPLADVYHASATVVEPPGFDYRDRFYPEFRDLLEHRPSMVYVGANDGMIHAFYASPDIHCEDEAPEGTECPRWQPGEEAWAYLPMNMISRALVASERGENRFFSQDLSCRYTDVQVDLEYRDECTDADKDEDPYCGWRTVLLCGQGWGGSWYVALDVTDPEEPKPMWEWTHKNMGRSWSLPAVSLVPMDVDGQTEPLWLATFGSGSNNEMYDCTNYNKGSGKCGTSNSRNSYRILNLEFDGEERYRQVGRGAQHDVGRVFVMNVATGKLVSAPFSAGSAGTPFVADGTVLDFNYDGVVDAAYMVQYQGVHRLRFDRTSSSMAMCKLPNVGNGVLTGHPTAYAYPAEPDAEEFPVVLVLGAGLDSGRHPDQQGNQGNNWTIESYLFPEKLNATCLSGGDYCDLAFNFNIGSRKARLLGAPLFSRQANKDDWILYTVWTAPHFNKVDACSSDDDKATGTAHLFCMDVTLDDSDSGVPEPRCEPCKGFKNNATDNVIYENESNPPTAPVSADGRVYLTDPTSGLSTVGITGSDDTKPKPNSTPPSAAIPATLMSWREVY